MERGRVDVRYLVRDSAVGIEISSIKRSSVVIKAVSELNGSSAC